MFSQSRLFLSILLLIPLLLCSPAWALDLDRLSGQDILQVKGVLSKLAPVIKQREAEQTLATLTFPELSAPLNESERVFLKAFETLDGNALGVSIPFRGMATGKEELTVIRNQMIEMDGEPYTIPPQYLPDNVYQAYLQMMAAMEADLGRRLYVESGYRSSAYQLYLFIYYLQNHEYSIAETVKWVALPGYSEHGAPSFQAIDFISQDGISGETEPQLFENLEEYAWLQEHAGKFGFVLSYPRGHQGITFEPWHWRYEN